MWIKNKEFKDLEFIVDSPIKGIVKTKFKKFYESIAKKFYKNMEKNGGF